MRERLASRWVMARAVVAAARAALRVAVLFERRPLDALVRTLRAGRPFAGRLRRPELHLRVVNRLLPYLPPFGMGRCVKRALLLADLWSRCGLEPSLVFGTLRDGGSVRGHAWVACPAQGLTAGGSAGYEPILEL